jgi:uncharacterized protein YggU (UPF0235/DUF167 family)
MHPREERLIRATVQASAKRERITEKGERLHIETKAKPERGEANARVRVLLSEYLKVPQTRVTLRSGHRSHNKIFIIRGQ